MIELIVFNENHELQYLGSCKVIINRIKQLLIVTSENPLKEISASFKWRFHREKNILFVFGEDSCEDFALVFHKQIRCRTVYSLIFKNAERDIVELEELEERFLNPFLNKVEGSESSKLEEIIGKWIKRYKKDHRMEKSGTFMKLASALNRDKLEVAERNDDSRKRQHSAIDIIQLEDDDDTVEVIKVVKNVPKKNVQVPIKKPKLFFTPEYKRILDERSFKLVTLRKTQKEFRRCLVVFLTPTEKSLCFEYSWNPKQKLFFCSGCRVKQKNNTGFMENLKTIKLEDKMHDCYPILYEPEKYMDIQIVQKPNYEIIENCDENDSKYIIVFSSDNQSQCHEYKWKKGPRRFECLGCENVIAKIFATDKEHVEIYNFSEHSCKTTTYDPEKYFQFNQFVTLPNFEIRKEIVEGIEKNLLVIFDEENRDICFYYTQHSGSERYFCRGCTTLHKDVTAKVFKNSDGEDYVIVSSAEHICNKKTYEKERKEIIIYPPNFIFDNSPKFHLPKLFIFDSNDPSLCYTFSPVKHGDKNKYYCISCDWHKRKTTKKPVKLQNGMEIKGVVMAYLCKNDETGEEYVEMYNDRKHLCKPKIYNPEKYMIKSDIIYEPSQFFLFRSKEKLNEIRAAIYTSKTKKSCYIFRCDRRLKSFQCVSCIKLKVFVSGRLYLNEDGKEYFKIKETQHQCKPINIALLNRAGITILKKSGLNLKEDKKEYDESKIIRDFELRNVGTSNQKLVIFFNKEKGLCYQFNYSKYRKEYRCLNCTRKDLVVKARMHHSDETGEDYVTMGLRSHECEPIKYKDVEDDEITKNYLVINSEIDDLPKKLIVFTSASKEYCYIYTKNGVNFQCAACFKSNKRNSAKICSTEAGEEYVKLLFKTEHICTPIKFDPAEYESKIIRESEFMIFDGARGQANTRMVIFDPKKENYVYEFKKKSKKSYLCIECSKKDQTTIAKIREKENGEKFIIVEAEHCCESFEYDSEKYIPKKIFYLNFVILPSKIKGIKRLIIFDEKEKYCGYEFYFQKYCNTFLCNGCESTKVRAKLDVDSNGRQFIEVGTRKHSCSIRNFFKEGQIYQSSEYKYIIGGRIKAIVVKHKTHPSLFYKLIYDEKEEAFCCSKCNGEKSITAGVPYKQKNGEEILILNKSHICTPLSQHSIV